MEQTLSIMTLRSWQAPGKALGEAAGVRGMQPVSDFTTGVLEPLSANRDHTHPVNICASF